MQGLVEWEGRGSCKADGGADGRWRRKQWVTPLFLFLLSPGSSGTVPMTGVIKLKNRRFDGAPDGDAYHFCVVCPHAQQI